MPAPPYMRFYVKSYCKATLALTFEEQGVYMRLLCTMWEHGGRLKDDDSYIAKALPIQIHKWRKVKPQLLPFLMEHSPGYLTQNKLDEEYNKISGDKKSDDSSTTGVTPPATRGVTPPVTPQVTRGVTPSVNEAGDKNDSRGKREEIGRFEDIPPGGVAHALARALDLSRSRQNIHKKSRLLEDGDGDVCGQSDSDAIAIQFVNTVIAAFEKHELHPPSDYSIVNGWVANGCDMLLDILPAVEASLNRLGSTTDPPLSWRYFVHEVYARKKSKKEK
jgi:uncharacterized protein YdaU (DUF1376 family)